MSGSHRTSSIQRPITDEVTRPTRRRRRAADGTPGRGLPERPLPGRPGNVLRAPTVAAARPAAARPRPTGSRPTAGPARPITAGRVRDRPAPTIGREAGRSELPTEAIARTDRVSRTRTGRGTATTAAERRSGNRPGSSRPAAGAARSERARPPFAVVTGESDMPAAASRRRARRPPRATEPAPVPAPGPKPADAAEPASRRRRARPTGRAARRKDAASPRSPLRDVTRPIARDSRMTERRPVRIGYGLIAAAIGLALVAALVVLPIRRWWDQRADLADRKSELAVLREANAQLSNDIAALNTPAGIEAAARTALNYGYPGEARTRSVGDPQAPIVLPAGYPYAMVNAILAARINLAATPPSPTATAPADPAATGAPGDTVPTDSTAPPVTEPPDPTIAPPAGNPLAPTP